MTGSPQHGQREAEDGEPRGAERTATTPASCAVHSQAKTFSAPAGASTVGLAYARTRWP